MIKRGVTLVELIIVIALMSFLATLSVRLLSTSSYSYVRAELERLYSFALYLQAQACREQKPQILHIDCKNNAYTVGAVAYTLHTGVTFGFAKGMCGPPSSPLKLLTKAITFKDNSIIFYPDGTSSSGAVYFTDTQRSCTYALTLGVSQVPYIRRYKYTHLWHMLI